MHKEEPSTETTDVPAAKRQRIEERPDVYSPSQFPLRLDDEQKIRRELTHEGEQGNIIITPTELEENVPQEPLEPVLDLTVANYNGKEIDPIISQAYDQFISDNDFVKTRAFKQFLW